MAETYKRAHPQDLPLLNRRAAMAGALPAGGRDAEALQTCRAHKSKDANTNEHT